MYCFYVYVLMLRQTRWRSEQITLSNSLRNRACRDPDACMTTVRTSLPLFFQETWHYNAVTKVLNESSSMPSFWPSLGGVPPPDHPACGYRGELCGHSSRLRFRNFTVHNFDEPIALLRSFVSERSCDWNINCCRSLYPFIFLLFQVV